MKCTNPCPGVCGSNANCRVNNHSPICSCNNGFTGDPFTRCNPVPCKKFFDVCLMSSRSSEMFIFLAPPAIIEKDEFRDPCYPSPCGLNAECRNINGIPSCSCRLSYIGQPPNCRSECTISAECPRDKACIREKCIDPCPGSCGIAAECNVVNHVPTCKCVDGYIGDPFTICQPAPPPRKNYTNNAHNEVIQQKDNFSLTAKEPERDDPCQNSPCGSNAQCDNGICTCLPEYHGDPYFGCRPECVLNSDCARDRACIRSKCIDPCPGTCGLSARCEVINHVPMCTCPPGMEGNAFVQCRPLIQCNLAIFFICV